MKKKFRSNGNCFLPPTTSPPPLTLAAKALIFALCILLAGLPAHSQTLYRSQATGAWNAAATWEVSTDNGANWGPAAATPTNANNDGISVRNTHTVSVTANVTVDQVTIATDGAVILTNGTWTIADGTGTDLTVDGALTLNGGSLGGSGGPQITVNGSVTNSSTASSFSLGGGGPTLVFNAGSRYEHARNSGAIPTATWDITSTCLVTGTTTTNPSGENQTFGNYTWNCAGMTENETLGQNNMSIAGNFTIISTGNFQLQLNLSTLTVSGDFSQSGGNFRIGSGTPRTLNVDGNFSLSGGTLTICDGNAANDVGTLNVKGDFSHTGGTIEETGTSGRGEINFTGTTPQAYSGTGGTVTGTVNYTVNASATLAGAGALGGTGSTTTNLGTIAPGASPGTLTISGDLTSSGTLSMEIASLVSFDQIIVSGTATITGDLEVDFGTFDPDAGDSFLLIDAGTYVGSPTVTVIPIAITAVYDPTTGILLVTSVLPIRLVSFTGERLGEVIELNWRTASEENNNYMAVERSADAARFTEIGRVPGAGTTLEPQDYTFTDLAPLPGANYYRLRQVDRDGRMQYHPVIYVDFVDPSSSIALRVQPNPARETMRVFWQAGEKERTQLRVFSAAGQLVAAYEVYGDNGTYELPVQQLAAGTYVLQVTHGKQTETLRFVKQ